MSNSKPATITVPAINYEMQQAHMKRLEEKVEALEKGQPVGVNTAQQEENQQLRSSNEQLKAELAAVKAALAAAPAPKKEKAVELRVSPKGGIMLLNLQGFPFTLYWEQLVKIFAMADDIRSFGELHKNELK